MNQCIVIRKEKIYKSLKTRPTPGKKLLKLYNRSDSVKRLPLNILEDNKIINDAEIHKQTGDLFFCLEGEAIFIYGGKLHGKKIAGGKETVLKPGDWLWIPPGQPHQHKCLGVTRLIIIKIPSRKS